MKLELTPTEFKQLIQLFTTSDEQASSTNQPVNQDEVCEPEEVDDLSIDELKERVYNYYYGTK